MVPPLLIVLPGSRREAPSRRRHGPRCGWDYGGSGAWEEPRRLPQGQHARRRAGARNQLDHLLSPPARDVAPRSGPELVWGWPGRARLPCS